MSFPDTRKIPPPTRPAFFSSRTCFASLNDDASSGFGIGPASASAGLEIRRELMGLKRSFVGSAEASESTMVMGTRRRFGGAVTGDVEDASDGTAISAGTVRYILLLKQRKSKTREHTVFPFPLKMSSSTRASSALTASFFGSILSAHCRSAWDKGKHKVYQKGGEPRTGHYGPPRAFGEQHGLELCERMLSRSSWTS